MARHWRRRTAPSSSSRTSTVMTASWKNCWGCRPQTQSEYRPIPLPESDGAAVQVHKIRLRIKTDSAPCHLVGERVQPASGKTAQAYVDRPALHVQAVLGDAARATAQRCVGPW